MDRVARGSAGSKDDVDLVDAGKLGLHPGKDQLGLHAANHHGGIRHGVMNLTVGNGASRGYGRVHGAQPGGQDRQGARVAIFAGCVVNPETAPGAAASWPSLLP